MMTTALKDRVTKVLEFYQELATYVKQATQTAALIAQAGAEISLAEARKDTKRQEQLQGQRIELAALREQATALALKCAQREDLAGCERLLGELEARMNGFHERVKGVYEMQSEFELAVASGDFAEGAPGLTRAEAEASISDAKERAERQLEQAEVLVPRAPVILTLP